MSIEHYEFDNANADGDKEAVIVPNPPTLINKLSANETNKFKNKLNELIDNTQVYEPIQYLELRLKFKGDGNTLPTLQAGDIVQGFASGSIIWDNAIYNGGDINDRSNYTFIDSSADKLAKGGYAGTAATLSAADIALGIRIDGKEDNTNKTSSLSGKEASNSWFPSLNGLTSWVKNFMFSWLGPHASEIADADTFLIGKSGIAGTRTWAQLKSILTTLYLDLTSAQNVSGVKNFLNGTLGLRNVANTFTLTFTNAITAARAVTWPDKSGTVAMTSDLFAQLSGTINYLVKFNSTSTGIISRIFDNGTSVGIGTINTPTKDITLGYQSDKEIGIEQSNSLTKGRDLTISAGRTINFIDNGNLVPLSQASKVYTGMTSVGVDLYAMTQTDGLYKQTGGTGNFVNIASGNFYDIAITSANDYYAVDFIGAIYKKTNGAGAWTLFQTITGSNIHAMATKGDNIYVFKNGGGIYMQTGGTGTFNNLSQTSRAWRGGDSHPNGNVYACVNGGDIYLQTGGTGNFVGLSQTSRAYTDIACAPNGNVFACVYGGDIYMQTGGTGSFVAMGQTSRNWNCMKVNSAGVLYAGVENGDIYILNTNALGFPDLDGGTLKLKSGTGKDLGKSRIEFITGQKGVSSGTNLQSDTLRGYFNELGHFVCLSTPIYANDAAADADTNLPSGAFYKTTGLRMILQKP